MDNTNMLSNILNEVTKKALCVFDKSLESVILYGSYARGDFDSDSDIDIMIIAKFDACDFWKYQHEFIKFTSRLGLENDAVISIVIKDSFTFHKFKNDLPFYQNVLKEGVNIAV